MNRNNEKKAIQLGMPHGTASAILRKSILFAVLKKHSENFCFQCNEEISSVDELSIEHKVPWLDSENPTELFFSLDNIAFSHLHCNSSAARRKRGYRLVHGTLTAYQVLKCRCDICKQTKALENKRNRR